MAWEDIKKGALAGGSSAIAGSLIGSLLNIGSGKRAKKQLKRQIEAQKELNEYNAKLNYDYGEKSADNAQGRSLELLEAERQANSLVTQVQDAKEAGASPGLAIGGGAGGTGATGGAQGDGAGGVDGNAPNFLDVAMLQIENKRANAEAAKLINESKLINAERRNIEADTGLKEADTRRKTTLTPLEARIIEHEGLAKWIENQKTIALDARGSEKGVAGKAWDKEYGEWTLGENNPIVKQLDINVEKANSETELNKALKLLTNEKTEHYFTEILTGIKNADANMVKANAVKLAVEHGVGEFTNWKTWVETGLKAYGAVMGHISGGLGVGAAIAQ